MSLEHGLPCSSKLFRPDFPPSRGRRRFLYLSSQIGKDFPEGGQSISYALGMPTMTAYTGLFNIGQPKASETLVVAAASGAVGLVVGQLGKIKGCHRHRRRQAEVLPTVINLCRTHHYFLSASLAISATNSLSSLVATSKYSIASCPPMSASALTMLALTFTSSSTVRSLPSGFTARSSLNAPRAQAACMRRWRSSPSRQSINAGTVSLLPSRARLCATSRRSTLESRLMSSILNSGST
jgi:hypothetical protein